MIRSLLPVVVLLCAGDAAAADGDPIASSDYAIDVFQGPVLGSSRAVGLAGAFSSIAEGVEGLNWNPAAVANRYPYSLSWWDYDFDVGFLLPTAVGGNDFDNDGETATDYDSFRVGLFGASLNFGYLGFGFEGSIQDFDIRVEDESGDEVLVDTSLLTSHLDVAFGFLHGQIVAGAGARIAVLSLEQGGDTLSSQSGVGGEFGILVRPDDRPFRFAAVGRTDVREEGKNCSVDRETLGFFLPCQVIIPWELQLGMSWMFGPHPYNREWMNPHRVRAELKHELHVRRAQRQSARERQLSRVPPELFPQEQTRLAAQEAEQRVLEDRELAREERRLAKEREVELRRTPRRYLLLSADLAITGPVNDAVSVESFVRQVELGSGDDLTYTPRLGAESEVVHDRLRLRAGTYLEPSRFRDEGPRLHGTFGLDVRLFYTTLFGLLPPFGVRASGVIDATGASYLQFAVSLGIWH